MNDGRQLERRLASAYAVVPADGFASTDRRIAALVAVADASRPPRRWRGLRLVLAVAAAFVVLAGAAVGAIRLLDYVATATPGTAVAWDQGVELNERQVHGDYAVTLARGYADVNQVVLGVSVERIAGAGQVDIGLEPELRDPAGVILSPSPAPSVGANEGASQAELLTFAPTTSSDGDYTLRLRISEGGRTTDTAWTFRFALPAPAGAVVNVDQTQASDQGSVELGEVRLSPTMISASLHLEPSDQAASGWGAIGYFKHGDRITEIAWGSGDLDEIAGTVEGTDDPAGAWTLVVTELVGERPDDTQVRLQGPWTFAFSVP